MKSDGKRDYAGAIAAWEKLLASNPLYPDVRKVRTLIAEHVFAHTAFWRRVGEEYQNPLIVTGSVLFTVQSRQVTVQRDRENFDSFGRRHVVPTRIFEQRTVYILKPKFLFIDGRTGTVMYSEIFREELSYVASQNIPTLSSYFELIDRVVPSVLGIVSNQTLRSNRTLLR